MKDKNRRKYKVYIVTAKIFYNKGIIFYKSVSREQYLRI